MIYRNHLSDSVFRLLNLPQQGYFSSLLDVKKVIWLRSDLVRLNIKQTKRTYRDLVGNHQSKIRLITFNNELDSSGPSNIIDIKINQYKARLLFLIIEKYLKIKNKSITKDKYKNSIETIKEQFIAHIKMKIHDNIWSLKYTGLEDLFSHLTPKKTKYKAILIRHKNQIFIIPNHSEIILPKLQRYPGYYTDSITETDIPWIFDQIENYKMRLGNRLISDENISWIQLALPGKRNATRTRPLRIVLPIILEHPRRVELNRDLGIRTVLCEVYNTLIKIIEKFNFRKDEELDKISLLNYCKTMHDFLNPHNEPFKFSMSYRQPKSSLN